MTNTLNSLTQTAWATDFSSLAIIWLGLYVITVLTFGFIFVQVGRGKLDQRLILPFSLNLIFNLAFGPLQTHSSNGWLAALDLVAALVTLVWGMVIIAPRYRWVSLAQTPYLLWISIATLLQLQLIFSH